MKRTILLFFATVMTTVMMAGNVTPEQALQKATNAVADQPEEVAKAPAKPKYQVKGKWFK